MKTLEEIKSKVFKFNPNHDPANGQFSSGDGGSSFSGFEGYKSNAESNEQLANELQDKLKQAGFFVSGKPIHSNTDYGESYYVYAHNYDAGAINHEYSANDQSFKFRVSDHSVGNSVRMAEEFHTNKDNIGDKITEAEKFAFPGRFDTSTVSIKHVQRLENVPESHLLESDTVVGSRVAKTGNKVYSIDRMYTNTVKTMKRKK